MALSVYTRQFIAVQNMCVQAIEFITILPMARINWDTKFSGHQYCKIILFVLFNDQIICD